MSRSPAKPAEKRLKRLGYSNIQVRHGDGYLGWPEEAPFDAIMITAAPLTIPKALVEQLKTGGRMVIPVGREHETQFLNLGIKKKDGSLSTTSSLPVAFVPMVKKVLKK